jgi:hypothetical protein
MAIPFPIPSKRARNIAYQSFQQDLKNKIVPTSKRFQISLDSEFILFSYRFRLVSEREQLPLFPELRMSKPEPAASESTSQQLSTIKLLYDGVESVME